MPFVIRRASAADCLAIPAIEQAAGERFRSVGLAAIAEAAPNELAFIEACQRHGIVLIAVLDDTPVGFVMAGQLDGALHLYELSVVPEHGRKGIGRALIGALTVAARDLGLARLSLSTFIDVPWNGPFYQRLGFVPVERTDWSPGFHMLHGIEQVVGLPTERRCFMRKPLD